MDQEPTYFKCENCNYEIEDISKYDYKWEDMQFCPNCGTPQINYCLNPECDFNEESNVMLGVWSVVPFEFKYCPKCGEKTSLYDFLISQEKESSSHNKGSN